jgi:hypothetical protein
MWVVLVLQLVPRRLQIHRGLARRKPLSVRTRASALFHAEEDLHGVAESVDIIHWVKSIGHRTTKAQFNSHVVLVRFLADELLGGGSSGVEGLAGMLRVGYSLAEKTKKKTMEKMAISGQMRAAGMPYARSLWDTVLVGWKWPEDIMKEKKNCGGT